MVNQTNYLLMPQQPSPLHFFYGAQIQFVDLVIDYVWRDLDTASQK